MESEVFQEAVDVLADVRQSLSVEFLAAQGFLDKIEENPDSVESLAMSVLASRDAALAYALILDGWASEVSSEIAGRYPIETEFSTGLVALREHMEELRGQ